MERIKPGKQYKPDFIKEPSPELPFENLGGSWILKKPIQTSDFVDGKTGFKLDPQSSYSKIMAFGGNTVLYDAVIDASGKGQFVSIQDAINAGKKRIFVRAGTYVIKETINLKNSQTMIVGESAILTSIFNGGFSGSLIEANGTTNNIIRDITLDGNNETGSIGFSSETGTSDYSTIENCIFQRFKTSAIYGTFYRVKINDNYFQLCVLGISTDSDEFKDIDGCSITNNVFAVSSSGDAIKANIEDGLIDGNRFFGVDAAIYLYNYSKNTIINKNIFSAVDYGVRLNEAVDIVVSNNIFHVVNEHCVNKGSTGGERAIIKGNLINACAKHGIYFNAGKRSVINDNIFYKVGTLSNNTYAAIYLFGDSDYNIISGNNISGDSAISNQLKYGIREAPTTANHNIITNNISSSAVTENISFTGADTVVANNIE